MLALLQWITDNNYVRYKDDKWYKPQFPSVYLKVEQLIELYESSNT